MDLALEHFSDDEEYFKNAFYYHSNNFKQEGIYKILVMYIPENNYKDVVVKTFKI